MPLGVDRWEISRPQADPQGPLGQRVLARIAAASCADVWWTNPEHRAAILAARNAPMRRKVVVNDRMQRGYVYHRTEPIGRNFAPDFRPRVDAEADAAARRVRRQVHDGLPATSSRRAGSPRAKLCAERHDATLNYFGVTRRSHSPTWRRSGWITGRIRAAGSSGTAATTWGAAPQTTRGRFARWRAIARHIAAIRNHCEPGDLECRRTTAAGCVALGVRRSERRAGGGDADAGRTLRLP